MHRSVEIAIGRLLTDEAFRAAFRRDPRRALADAAVRGLELTESETAALLETDRALWDRVASDIDERLQKARLCLPSTDELP